MNTKQIVCMMCLLGFALCAQAQQNQHAYEDNLPALQQAAEQGDAAAQAELGKFYIEEKQGERAWPLLKASAKKKNPEGLYALGFCYETGQCGEAQNYKKAVSYYKKAFKKKSPEGTYRLAVLTHDGQGTKANLKKALSYMHKAADLGSLSAVYFLASAYTLGQTDGVEQDYQKAALYWKKLAAAGDGEACFNLGYLYYYGYGVEKDLQKAFEWDLCAAQRGLPQGQYQVGLAYVRGEGVPEDISKGIEWIRQAAEQGFEPAQKSLDNFSYFLYTGPDLGEAGIGRVESVPHLKERAEQGSAAAQYLYASFCEQRPQNAGEACDADYWYQKAAEQGLEPAINKLKERNKK